MNFPGYLESGELGSTVSKQLARCGWVFKDYKSHGFLFIVRQRTPHHCRFGLAFMHLKNCLYFAREDFCATSKNHLRCSTW